MTENLIDRKAYPELDLLLWDDHRRYIQKEEAFHYYETRWRYLDTKRLDKKEQRLIDELTRDIGKGVMLK